MKTIDLKNKAAGMQPKPLTPTLAAGNDESSFEDLVEDIQADNVGEKVPEKEATEDHSDWLPTKPDGVVEKINAIAHRSVERGMEEIGEYLLTAVFKSDLAAVSSKNPRKRALFTAICEHPNLRMDPRRLGEAVKAAALGRLLNERSLDLHNLTYTHKVHISRIPNQEKMIEVAIEANEKGYKVSQLRDIVAGFLPGKNGGLGKVIVKAISNPNEMLANQEHMQMLTDPARITEELDEADRIGLRVASARTRQQLMHYCDFLQHLEASLFDIELTERQKLLPAE